MIPNSQYIIEVLFGSMGALLSLALGIFCLVLYSGLLQKKTQHEYIGWFSVVLLITGIWALLEVWNEQNFLGGYELAATYGIGTLLPLSFYLFVRSLNKTLKWGGDIILFLIIQITVIIFLLTPEYGMVSYSDEGSQLRLGSFAHLVFVSYMLGISYIGLSALYKLVKSNTINYARGVFIAMSIPFSIVAITNILIPYLLLDNSYHRIGPLGLVFMAAYITYIIIKQEALKIPVILFQLYALGTIFITAVSIHIGLSFFGIIDILQIEKVILLIILAIIIIVLMRQTIKSIDDEVLVSKTHKKLKASVKEKNQFIQISSHQLRTPITAIKGYSSLLKEVHTNKHDEIGHYVIQMDAIIQNMSTIIEDVLNVNSLNSGTFGVRIEDDIHIKDQIQSIIDNKSFLFQKLGIAYSYKTKGSDFMLRGDEVKIREVFNNAIDNALQYGKKNIEITLESNAKDIIVEIKDDGIGVLPSEQKTLFKAYHRGKYAQQIRQDGTGLGLHLMKLIVEAHKGTVSLISKGRNQGALLKIKIPKSYHNHK